MPTIQALREDIKATIMACCLHENTKGLDHQADALMRMLDAKYFNLEQMEAEAEGILGPK